MTTAEPGSRAGAGAGPPAAGPRGRAGAARAAGRGRSRGGVRAGSAPAAPGHLRQRQRGADLRADRRGADDGVDAVRRPAAPGRRSAPSPTTGTGCCARVRSVSEYRLRRPGGGLYWIRDEQSVVRDADGRTVEIVGSLLDVTEQKRTEERAERLQELTAGLAAALTPEHVAASALLPALAVLEAQGVALMLRDDGRRRADAHVRGAAGYQSRRGRALAAAAAGRRHPGRVRRAGRHAGVRRLGGRGAGALPGDVPGPVGAPPAAPGRRCRCGPAASVIGALGVELRRRARASRRPSAGSWRRSRTSARWRWSGPGSTGPPRPSGSGWPRCCPGCRPA